MSLTGDIVKHVVQVSAVALVITGMVKGWHQYCVAIEHVPGGICDVVRDKIGLVTDLSRGDVIDKAEIRDMIKTDSNVTPKDSTVSAKESKEKKKRQELATGVAAAGVLWSLIYLCSCRPPSPRHTPDPDERPSWTTQIADWMWGWDSGMGATYFLDFTRYYKGSAKILSFVYNNLDMINIRRTIAALLMLAAVNTYAPDVPTGSSAVLPVQSGPVTEDSVLGEANSQGSEKQESGYRAFLPNLAAPQPSDASNTISQTNSPIIADMTDNIPFKENPYEVLAKFLNPSHKQIDVTHTRYKEDQMIRIHYNVDYADIAYKYTADFLEKLSIAGCKVAYATNSADKAIAGIILLPDQSIRYFMSTYLHGFHSDFSTLKDACLNNVPLPAGYSWFQEHSNPEHSDQAPAIMKNDSSSRQKISRQKTVHQVKQDNARSHSPDSVTSTRCSEDAETQTESDSDHEYTSSSKPSKSELFAAVKLEIADVKSKLQAKDDENAKLQSKVLELTSHIENLEKRISEGCPRCSSA